jgi:hypothetical protein
MNTLPEKLMVGGIAHPATPKRKSKLKKHLRFLRKFVYAGLPDLNTGFDSPLVVHLSPEDFLVVIDLCEALHVHVKGIEVFTTDVEPPSRATVVDYNIPIPPEDGYEWARQFVRQYEGAFDITICATFGVPDSVYK